MHGMLCYRRPSRSHCYDIVDDVRISFARVDINDGIPSRLVDVLRDKGVFQVAVSVVHVPGVQFVLIQSTPR